MHLRADHSVARALTIAGSDSGGGAGIQADLKTFTAFGVFGASCVTAVTAQNTRGVQAIHDVPTDVIARQMQSVFEDIRPHTVKVGMLSNVATIKTVARELRRADLKNVVVDPVMVAKGGAPLLTVDSTDALLAEILPLAAVLTPNVPEAEVLCSFSIRTMEDAKEAAIQLKKRGPRIVIIKGGHAAWGDSPENSARDLVYDGATFTTFATRRVPSKKTHGTGCTFSSAIAACLAREMSELEAIGTAKRYVYDAIAAAAQWDIGAGHGPIDHTAPVEWKRGFTAGKDYDL